MTSTTFSTSAHGILIASGDSIRNVSIMREAAWDLIIAGTHPDFGADDFRDHAHFIECAPIR